MTHTLNTLDKIGTGYTEATILEFIKDDKSKFIGYIPTKEEYIIATVFADNSYGWTIYGSSIQNVLESYKHKNTDYSKEFYVERLDSALAEAVDALEYWNEDEDCINLVEECESIRWIINE